jgi:uncharacterized protein YbjT (DUF2867 family)
MTSIHPKERILLTGTTGYIGGRLLSHLCDKDYSIRCLVRNSALQQRLDEHDVEVFQGDVFDPASLSRAMEGVSVAFYMIHSMTAAGDFHSKDVLAARNFGAAAKAAGVKRIIYLGGLGDSGGTLSSHLKSRQAVGEILRESGIHVLEFRASIVIGAGSLSFEMIRALVERLPVMVTPRWVSVPAQPIFITDVLQFLELAIQADFSENRIFEIGGRDIVSYKDIMKEYARQRGLMRYMIPVPVLTPYLSSLWLTLITPIFARIGRNMIDSIRHSTVVRDSTANQWFSIEPIGISDSIAKALSSEEQEIMQTRWSEQYSSKSHASLRHVGNMIIDSYSRHVNVDTTAAFSPIQHIGGSAGWYACHLLWKSRAWIDRAFGGIGYRRGRTNALQLVEGDQLDWWTIEYVLPGRIVRLRNEMKVPGRIWLQYEITDEGEGSQIRQTTIFDPHGLFGLAYWYLLYPVHSFIFRRMLHALDNKARPT